MPTLPTIKFKLPNLFAKKAESSPSASKPAPTDLKTTDLLSPESANVQDLIAPSFIEVDFNHVKIGSMYHRTLFVAEYPRYIFPNWMSPIIDFDHTLDIAFFIYPVESKTTLQNLRRKIAEMQATIEVDIQRGKVVDPEVQAKLDDALALQEELAKGSERFFQFAPYFTIVSPTLDDLDLATKEVTSALASLSISAKPTTLQMEDGFKATLPHCVDKLMITRNMDTTSLATTFPFTSSELTANEGVLYGINEHNESLIIFDRFSLENYNEVVLGKSGSGKSYLIKIEALRSLMFGTDVIIIDPEEEYKDLCVAVGGEYISFSFTSAARINPFELVGKNDNPEENELQQKINFTLTRLLKIMVGTETPEEEAIIHNALEMTYAQKGITFDPDTHRKEPPLLEDLYKVLIGFETDLAQNIALRLEKFVKGSFGNIFNQKSTVNLQNSFTVFSFKNLEDQLRTIATFIIVDYIHNQIRRNFKRRILIVDEAWYLMKNQSSAEFLWDFAKRARKNYLGLTTITQDIEDFLTTDLGKAIVTNSSIQILMKQSPVAIEKLSEVFLLSEGEKEFLLASGVGECIFFAGSSHVAMNVVSSPEEHELVTTNPIERAAKMKEKEMTSTYHEAPQGEQTQLSGRSLSELEKTSQPDTTRTNLTD